MGALLAELLGAPLHDTDAAIEASQGRSISDIFVDDGEPAFRDLERPRSPERSPTRTGESPSGAEP